MPNTATASIRSVLAGSVQALDGSDRGLDALMALIGDARFVLLGEATHGTHEFYRERARITRRLITEKGFAAVAVEADWPDAYRVNRYVRGLDGDSDAERALSGFKRFPAWMWRNHDVAEFAEWLRAWNASRAAAGGAGQVGFYGLDLYSMFASMEEVLRYLDRHDPEAARRARMRYACFEHFADDGRYYGNAAGSGRALPCEEQAIAQLAELQARGGRQAAAGTPAADEYFYAEQNARLVKNAERYYRSMFEGRIVSWNLRDRHMADTLQALAAHLSRPERPAKIAVWEHNSHIGDARATELGRAGEWNVGQLVRTTCGDDAVLIGFTTHHGTVTAASEWDAPAECKEVRPALAQSWEQAFHDIGVPHFLLPLRGAGTAQHALAGSELIERAIGVIYLPLSERRSHYFSADLADQFDAVIHIDETSALQALDAASAAAGDEPPETYPQGL